MRAGPAEVIEPNDGESMELTGSPRLVWFNELNTSQLGFATWRESAPRHVRTHFRERAIDGYAPRTRAGYYGRFAPP